MRSKPLVSHNYPNRDTFVLENLPLPIANFSSTANGYSYQFQDSSSGNNLSYLGDFGDGSPPFPLSQPSHTYAANGTYQVCLTISSQACETSHCDSLSVWVVSLFPDQNPEIAVYPNPNAGTFNLQGPNIRGFELYNLTGQILLKRSFPNPSQIQSVNLPEIPRGTYLMKEYSQKGFVKMKIQINP